MEHAQPKAATYWWTNSNWVEIANNKRMSESGENMKFKSTNNKQNEMAWAHCKDK
jgi:hypothetical protein